MPAPRTDTEIIGNLRSFAADYGAVLQKSTTAEMIALRTDPAFTEAPFTSNLGVDWERRIVYYVEDRQWPEIIHELGHVLASDQTPYKSVEFDFLGWELALVHLSGGSVDTWLHSNAAYAVYDGEEISGMHALALHRMMAERMEHALSLKLISTDGKPLCVRP